jgi:hypothetical protein
LGGKGSPGVKRDPFYNEISKRLDGSLDPDVFEACVCDLLRPEFPSLVPVRGGSDSGMDGAIADGEGPAYPLVCTTSTKVSGNLDRNLRSYLEGGGHRRKVVVATSRSLSARRKRNLEKKAEEHGFELVQIFDKAAIADRLYHSPKWCLELLELTGNAPTLSPTPGTTRPLTEHELIGREADLVWLRETNGDVILVGQPGSGKTSLLYKLARENRGLFIVGDDLSRVACEVREKNPKSLYLDDAHVDPDQLVRLVQMRRDLHAAFSIVATVWPGGRNEVIERLGVPGTRVRELELLTRDQIVQVLRSVGLMGSTGLIREIVDQSRGLPGLAVTLADLCLREGVREVALGTALKRSVHVTLMSLVGELAIEVLSCFALGGDQGMAWDAVAQVLEIAPLDIRRIVAGLEASGVITDLGDGVLAVYPHTLRHTLVRDMFFTGPVRLDPNPLMQSARRARGVAETLVGARAVGAPISGEYLWPWLERADTDNVWARYAWLGREETLAILRKRPDRLITVAAVGLLQAPEEVIPRLLGEAVGEPRNLGSNLTQPLRLIRDWVQEADPGRGEALKRRRILLEEALTWLDRGEDENTGLCACLIAFSPRFEWSETDPGAGRTFTITHGYLLPEELDRLGELWSKSSAHYLGQGATAGKSISA